MPAAAVAVHTGIGHAESFTHLPRRCAPRLDLPDVGILTGLLRGQPPGAKPGDLPGRIGAAVACPRLEPRRGT